jgi:hypothetical protein
LVVTAALALSNPFGIAASGVGYGPQSGILDGFVLGFLLRFLAELIAGGLLGAVGFIMIHATYVGPQDAVFTVFRLLAYVFGVFIGVITTGGLTSGDGNVFLALLGAAAGAVVLQIWGSNTFEDASTFLDLLQASFLSVAVFGPILASSGYALGRVGRLISRR